MTDDAPPPAPKRTRHRWGWRVIFYSLFLALLLGIASLLGAFYLAGQAYTAPPWLQQRIEARIARELPQARVTFGEMTLVAGEGLAPQVRLRDVDVRTPQGAEIISLNEFSATVSGASLLQGQVKPRALELSGVFAALQRAEDGRVSLQSGFGAGATRREAATLPQLIGQLDGILAQPALDVLEDVDLRAVTLRFVDLRANREWTVDGGRLRLARAGPDVTLSADLAVLSGGAGVATLDANYTSKIGETAAEFGVRLDGVSASDIAAQGPAFAWLDVLRAPISGAVRSGLTAEGRIAPLNATLQIGAGVVQPNAGTQPIPFDGARSYFNYDPATGALRFDEVAVDSKWVSGSADGTAVLGLDAGSGAFTDMVGQFTFRDVSANPDGVYKAAVDIEEAGVDFQMTLDPFRVQLGRLQVSDQGKTLLLNGDLQADKDGWRVALDAQMDSIVPARLLALWPESVKTKTRRWLLDNLLEADVTNLDAALRLAPDADPQTYVAFDYSDARVRFLKAMPPITDGRGHFSLLDNRLVIALDAGDVVAPQGGTVDVAGSAFILPDVTVKGGTPAVIRLATDSSATAVLSLLNQPPLRVMDKAGMDVDIAQGRVVVTGTLAVPLRKGTQPSDMVYHFAGDLRDLRSTALVKGRTLAANRMAVRVDNAGLELSGDGTLDGIPFTGTWAQPIGAGADRSTVRGDVTLSAQALDTFGIALPKGMVDGRGTGRIALDFARGRAARYSLTSTLEGLTLRVPQVSWVKPANTRGALEVAGQLGATPTVETLRVRGAGLDAQGDVTLRAGGALARLRFARLKVGNWLDIPVDLIGQGAGRPVQVVLRGGTLDLRRAEFGSSGGRGAASGPPGPPMRVNLDRLQITDTIALTGLSGQFGTARGLDGSFVAALNGGTRVQGRVLPQGGRSAVRLTSNDAGGVLRSAGLLKQIVGGTLDLNLLPVGSGGAFDGRVTAKDIRVKDAPGIAALLNAVSVVGLVNEMNGDGIYFDEVEGDFRLTSDRLTLTKASAVGASMGLSMDGVYALARNEIAMQGVITPVYLLNGIGSLFTRKGEGLFGFNYTLRGPASQPQVSVNPLSALAPGGLRDALRGPQTQLPEVDGVTGSVLPKPEPAKRKPIAEDTNNR